MELKQIESNIIKENPDFEDRLKLYYEEAKKIEKLKEESKRILDRIAVIESMASQRKKQEYDAAGFFKRILFNSRLSFTEDEQVEIQKLQNMLGTFPAYYTNEYYDAYSALSRLSKIQTLIAQKEKGYFKKKTDRAVVAAFKNKSRDLAGQIKSDLREQMNIDPHCPYCGEDMGDDPHCDHIYPLSKGGLSTPQNMVYVCSECNLKKTNLTLTQFINRFHVQRLEIESRLEKLGKDY